MTAAHVPTLGRPPRRTIRQYGAVAAGLALVLLVAAGVVLWQVTRGDESTGPTEAEVTLPVAPAVTPRDQSARTYFIVASQAQADTVQREINDGDSLRAALGTAPVVASVVLFPSVEAEVQFWSTMGEQERAGQGLTADTVVDLRAPVPPAPAPDALVHDRDPLAAAVSDPEMYQRWRQAQAATPAAPPTADAMPDRNEEQVTVVQRSVYLVGSEEAATVARPLAAGGDQVLVVETEEDAAQVRIGFRQPGTTIIDLRSPADAMGGSCGMPFEPASC